MAVTMKDAVYMPHTAGRYQAKRFRKAQVDRLPLVVFVFPLRCSAALARFASSL